MTPSRVLRAALWLLDHLALGPHAEALAGDLHEELEAGCSALWLWRQVIAAILFGLWNRTGSYLLPLLFSVLWTPLYTGWRFFGADRLTHVDPARYATLAWPFSSCMEIVNGVIPAVTFIWLGLMLYIFLRSDRAHRTSPFHITLGLSVSLSTLLLATLGLMHQLTGTGLDLRFVTQDDFYLTLHLFAVSIPLALSLFTAILLSFPRTPRSPVYRKKLAR
jgi:hypothetical protein